MKRLILCCDGTWDTADSQVNGKPLVSNVVRLAVRVAKRDGDTPQVVYYHQGVGTGDALDKIEGGVAGAGLEDDIRDAYRFLVANFEAGDEIYLFGFSRGAFTARSIAGMIRKCGILSREHVERYDEAITLYRDAQHPDDDGPVKFRTDAAMTVDTPIKMIGVFDTVGALGVPIHGLGSNAARYQFHDTELSGSVQFAYQALAINERRGPFQPSLWDYVPKPPQVIAQVWFVGVHSDIGGGAENEEGLSDITLDWMLGKAAGTGLALDASAMASHPLHPDVMTPFRDSRGLMYRLTSAYDRPIGLMRMVAGQDPTQSLHPSVLTRWDGDASYRPVKLIEYFKATGDPRGNA